MFNAEDKRQIRHVLKKLENAMQEFPEDCGEYIEDQISNFDYAISKIEEFLDKPAPDGKDG